MNFRGGSPRIRMTGVAILVAVGSLNGAGEGRALAFPGGSGGNPTSGTFVAPAPNPFAEGGAIPVANRVELGPIETISESLFGDVYDGGKWRPLTLGTFLTDGWLEPWAEAPAGREGRTPRHGWLGSFDGVFYRLWLADFGYHRDINLGSGGNRYVGDAAIFLPFSRRFEFLIFAPFVVSNGTPEPRRGYTSRFGDLSIVPRFLLAEGESSSHVFAVEVRTPTGSRSTGNDFMGLLPRYEFWANPVGPWIVRGSIGAFAPLNKAATPSRTAIVGGFAAGRYFRPHDVPFGDLVFYGACNFYVPLDGAASTGTSVSVGPGTRFHLGKDFYFLNFWNFPVTGPPPEAFSVQVALLKVF